MKLNPREKVMLAILGLAAAIFLSYYFVLMPKMENISTLRMQLTEKESEVARVRTEIASAAQLDEEHEILTVQIEEETINFYPEILQKRIILLLDEIFGSTGVTADNTGFSQIEKQNDDEDGSPILERMSVTFPYQASYEQVMDFVTALEAMERVIIINSLQMAQADGGLLNGGMNVDFYAIAKPRPQDRDAEYQSWPYTDDYGRFNPFPEGTTPSPLPEPEETEDEDDEDEPDDQLDI